MSVVAQFAIIKTNGKGKRPRAFALFRQEGIYEMWVESGAIYWSIQSFQLSHVDIVKQRVKF